MLVARRSGPLPVPKNVSWFGLELWLVTGSQGRSFPVLVSARRDFLLRWRVRDISDAPHHQQSLPRSPRQGDGRGAPTPEVDYVMFRLAHFQVLGERLTATL